MKRRVLLASLALLVSSAAFGCAATVESESTESADTEAATVEKEKPSLGEFLEADTKTGERVRFGQRHHHQQVGVFFDQRHGALSAEGNIGLVYDDYAVWIEL